MSIYKKLAMIQKSLPPLKKSGYNSFHKYHYSTADDVLVPVRKACNDCGLFLTLTVVQQSLSHGCAEVTVRATVVDAESGETHAAEAGGYADDLDYKNNTVNGNKALFKAETGAKKYAVSFLFGLTTDDEPERDEPVKTSRNTVKPFVSNRPAPVSTSAWKSEEDAISWGRSQLPDLPDGVIRKMYADTQPVNGKKSTPWMNKVNELVATGATDFDF